MKKRTSLRNKITTAIVLVVLFLGLSITFVVNQILPEIEIKEAKGIGSSMAKHLADRSLNLILTDNLLGLKDLIDKEQELVEGIDYIFIMDAKDNVLAHTFAGGFPIELTEANVITSGQLSNVQLLDTGEGLVYDISVPILIGDEIIGTVRVGMSEERTRMAVNSTLGIVIGTTIVAIFFSVFIGFGLAGLIVNPVKALHRATEEMIKGNLDVQVDIGTGDEIEQLAVGFNKMTADLKDYQTNLENKVKGRTAELENEISERRKAESRLTKINQCFLGLRSESSGNFSRLTALCGELLGATCALYNRLDKGMLCSVGQWQAPANYNPVAAPEGHICYDVIRQAKDEVFVVRDLPKTIYAQTDPNVMAYKLQTYVGKAVKCRDKYIGSLCLVYQKDYLLSAEDKEIIEIVAAAIGLEEERQMVIQELRQANKTWYTTFNSITDLVSVQDRDYKLVQVNKAYAKAFNLEVKEVIGKTCYELVHGTKKPWPKCTQKRVLETKKPVIAEFFEPYLEIYLQVSTSPIVDEKGEVADIVHIAKDITKRKKAEEKLRKAYIELKQTQAQLIQTEKMACIGQLAAGVAHEINNPTAFVVSNLNTMAKYIKNFQLFFEQCQQLNKTLGKKQQRQLAQMQERLEIGYILEDLPQLVTETAEGAERIKRIIQALRSFSRPEDEQAKLTNVNACIESALPIVWNELKYKTEVFKEYGQLPKIMCFPQQLSQVFVNLFVNAAQAIENKGKITIKTYTQDKNIYIQIADTGRGIPKEVISKIFDPFYTSKPVGKGTGLGLSIVHRIIEKHKGQIAVESKPGRGTTFTISLPFEQGKKIDS